MKNKIYYQLFFCVTASLALFSFIPTTVGQMMETRGVTQIEPCCKNFSDEAEIQVSLCFSDGSITNNSRNISVKNALELTDRLLTIDDTVSSFEESFKQKLVILKELDLVADEITIECVLGETGKKWLKEGGPTSINPLMDKRIIFNGGGILSFLGIPGFGLGFGMNSFIPVVGWDNVGIYFIFGGVTSIGLPNIHRNLNGFIIGGFIGFAGILFRVLYPYVYGPFVFGFGISGPTIWLKPSIPIIGRLNPFF